jgi:hypothetical protein
MLTAAARLRIWLIASPLVAWVTVVMGTPVDAVNPRTYTVTSVEPPRYAVFVMRTP